MKKKNERFKDNPNVLYKDVGKLLLKRFFIRPWKNENILDISLPFPIPGCRFGGFGKMLQWWIKTLFNN